MMWTKNERKGKVHLVKGKVKHAAGALTRNDDLKAVGRVDEIVGKVETAVGRMSRKTGHVIMEVGNALKW